MKKIFLGLLFLLVVVVFFIQMYPFAVGVKEEVERNRKFLYKDSIVIIADVDTTKTLIGKRVLSD